MSFDTEKLAVIARTWSLPHTKRLRRIRNAQHFRFALNLVSTAQWFRLGGRRRSLLNAALWGYRSPIVYLS